VWKVTTRLRARRWVAALVCVWFASLGGALPAAAQAAKGGKPVVTLTTSLGVIEVELDADKAPITVKNFLDYVDAGFYDGTIFHRVIPNFMIQGGGFTTKFEQKTTKPPIKNEAQNGLVNARGTLAMARTNVVDSATGQFVINLKDNDFLNHSGPGQAFGYAVFGKVVKGMDVVDKIAAVQTGSKGGHQDVPKTDVVIQSAKRKK
jgi:cyclophilin family peptidyl-prolyl cis-trans isomerase